MNANEKGMVTNDALMARRAAAMPRGVGQGHPLFAERAENGEVWDVEGRRWIDFCAGIAVVNTGHRHPKVIAAAKAQLDKFTHTCFQVVAYEPYVELCERLNKAAPGPTPKKSFLINSGAEAVENAVKIARVATGRQGIIAFGGGFHGRTMMGMALTGKVVPYKVGFGPFPAEIFHIPFPVEYHGVSMEDSLAALDKLFKSDVEASRIAAMIVEPVQGEGGFYPVPPGFLKSLRRICDEHGIVMVADEIQTGFGRTGKLFAVEHAGIEPDLMTVAKSLAGGFPLSGVIGKAEIMDSVEPGGLGGTYAGSPFACAAGLAVLDIIQEEKLCEKADAIGAQIKRWAEKVQADTSCIGHIRITGAMCAIEIVDDNDAERPNADLTKAIAAEAAKRGVILLTCGVRGNVIRFLPPLTIGEALMGEALQILGGVIRDLAAQIRKAS
jgi:4-aminobutyrate aminotransferase